MDTTPRVLVDLVAVRKPHVGIGRFCDALGAEFARMHRPGWRPVFLLPPAERGRFGGDVATEAAGARQRVGLGPRFDLWHATHQTAPHRPRAGTPTILTIHDLNFLAEKSEARAAGYLERLRRRARRARLVTTISEFTAQQVREHIDLGDVPLEVVRNGVDDLAAIEPARPELAVDAPFLLALCAVRPKKNLHVLPSMLAHLPGLALVVAGDRDHAYADAVRREAERAGVADRTAIVGVVSEPGKAWLYRHCEALVFPSLHEGFGLPVLEAMTLGKPVFCARATSLPEVGGDLAVYWDDFDPCSMAAIVRDGLRAAAEDAGFPERARRHAARFNWRVAAERYADLYERVLGRR